MRYIITVWVYARLPLELLLHGCDTACVLVISSGRRAYTQTVMMYRIVYNLVDIPYSITSLYLSSNQRPFTKISGTTHKNYSVQDIILPTSHTPLEPTTWKCGGSRHPRQLQGLSCLGQLSSKFTTVFILLTCTVHRRHPHPKVRE